MASPYPSGIAPLAQRQLTAWQDLARSWSFALAERDGQRIMACGECGAGIWLITDTTGTEYAYDGDQKLGMVVLHLRARHADLEPDGL